MLLPAWRQRRDIFQCNRPQVALRETPRHKVRRVTKLRERIAALQKEVAELQVRARWEKWSCFHCARTAAASGIL